MKKSIFLLCITFSILHAEIDFTQIKGLYTVFRKDSYLSPIHGFAWWNGGNIERLYRYGDPQHKTIQLIKELFYLNPGDGLTFGPTILPSKIGTYITPGAIGIIINTLELFADHQSLKPHEEQELEKRLEEKLAQEINYESILGDTKQKQQSLRTALKSDISSAMEKSEEYQRKLPDLEKEKTKLQSNVTRLKNKVTQLSGQRNALRKKRPLTDELTEQIKDKEKEITLIKKDFEETQHASKQIQVQLKEYKSEIKKSQDAVRRYENKIRNAGLASGSLHEFVELIVRAFEESLPNRQQFLPFTIQNVMLGLLWKKVTIKQDFINYFSKLDRANFNDPSLLTEHSPTQRLWLKEQYNKKMYQTISSILMIILKTKDKKEKINLLRVNFEPLCAAWYSYDIFTSVFPPQVLSGWTTYQDIEFADCGSTSLRNALNNMIYQPEAGSLSLSELTTHFKISDALRGFYSQFGSVEQTLEEKTRKAWAAVTSGLNSEGDNKIDYKSPPGNGFCEVAARSGIRNMNNVVRKLLGIDSIDKLDQLPHVSISKQLAKDPNFGIYTFRINNKYTFKWYFEPVHFFVSIEPAYIKTDPTITQFMQSFDRFFQSGNSMSVYESNNRAVSLLSLYRDKLTLFDSLVNELNAQDFSEEFIHQMIITLFDSRTVSQKLIFIDELFNNMLARSKKANIELLKRFVHEMVYDVEQHYADIMVHILNSPVLENIDYPFYDDLETIIRTGINTIKAKYPQLMPSIVMAILNNKRAKFYGMLKKNIQFKPDQLIKIIQIKATPLYGIVKQFLERIKEPLNSVDRILIKEAYKNNIDLLIGVIQKRLNKDTIQSIIENQD